MTSGNLVSTTLIVGFMVAMSPLGAAEEPGAFEQAAMILKEQVQSANSRRARLEIQMRLLSPEEQRQAGEFAELEYQLSRALGQLEEGKVSGTMDLEGNLIESARLDYRQWKRELARIDGVTEPGPAWQLRQLGKLINSRQFFQGWPAGEETIPRPLRRMVIEQVNARLLVAIQILHGVERPKQEGALIFRPTR